MPVPITPLTDIPTTADPANFDARADSLLNVQLPRMVSEMNAVAMAMTLMLVTSISDDTLTIGTGETDIVIEPGKSFLPGMTVKVVAIGHPLIWMLGDVLAYDRDSGELSLQVYQKAGVGTFGQWSVFMAAAEHLDDEYLSRLPTREIILPSDYLVMVGADGVSNRVLSSGLGVQVGSIFMWPTNVLPDNCIWVPAAATSLSRTTYSRLHAIYAAAGYPWGNGDGSTTFNTAWMPPNYAPLQTDGTNVATQTVGQVIAHDHTNGFQMSAGSGQAASGSPNFVNTRNTGSTGGPANLAAGVRMRFAQRYQ